MIAVVVAPILLLVSAPPDDRSEALALIERLGGRYHIDPDKRGKPVVSVAMPFLGGLQRQRIWTFWRRVLHTCHRRTQVQTWLRLVGQHVPAIYGPSGDVTWDEADPTYSVEAAERGAWT